MSIPWNEILIHSILKNSKVLAGVNGLNKSVRSLSVYDCEEPKDFNADEKGVLYISLLSQFRESPERLYIWISKLIQRKASGICTIEDSTYLLDPKILQLCNNAGFPIISINKDIPYADIIENISVLLYFSNVHLKNEEIIDTLISKKLSELETLDTLKKINTEFRKFIRVISLTGIMESRLDVIKLNRIFSKHKQHSYVKFHGKNVFIMSYQNDTNIEKKMEIFLDSVVPYFQDQHYGIGELCYRCDIAYAIRTSFTALEMAKVLDSTHVVYNKLSTLPMLMRITDCKESKDFYLNVLEKIHKYDTSNSMELVDSIGAFVECKGDYKQTAKMLFQHENTVRYRIKKVKELLDVTDNVIEFYHIMSLFCKLEKLYKNG